MFGYMGTRCQSHFFPSLHSSQAGHTSREQFSGVNQLWQVVLGVSRKRWHFKRSLPLRRERLWDCDRRDTCTGEMQTDRIKRVKCPDVPGCLPGRGSQTERGGNLWGCALERCSPDIRSESPSSVPGSRRKINTHTTLKNAVFYWFTHSSPESHFETKSYFFSLRFAYFPHHHTAIKQSVWNT